MKRQAGKRRRSKEGWYIQGESFQIRNSSLCWQYSSPTSPSTRGNAGAVVLWLRILISWRGP
eukprot:1684373-Rhodomonas_salina.1